MKTTFNNKTENTKYQTVGTIPKSNRQIVDAKSIPITHMYMTAHFICLVQVFQQ